jgi:osmotically inducible protein OsmC
MATIERRSGAVWRGDLRKGKGEFSTGSGAVAEAAYSFHTRFEDEPGSNPEELIAAAHAGCYSMAFAGTLGDHGYKPESIETLATCTLSSKKGGGWEITHMRLDIQGRVPDIDEKTFEEMAKKADAGCPVSNLLRCGLEIEHHTRLL